MLHYIITFSKPSLPGFQENQAMNKTLLALSISLSLAAWSAHAAPADTDPAAGTTADPATTLSTVEVNAKLDQSRNQLSPGIGASQYTIDSAAIEQLPLGDATPLNQVILQAPGVVQDSYGQLHVRGDHANLQYRINGVIIPESISGFGQTLDARTLQSVNLLDGALPAQYGLRTAAVVDITTKSGYELGNGGSVGITGGSFGTLTPNASIWAATTAGAISSRPTTWKATWASRTPRPAAIRSTTTPTRSRRSATCPT